MHSSMRSQVAAASRIVALTATGRQTLSDGARATDDAERAFLAPLSAPDARRLRRMLQAIVAADERTGSAP